MKVEKIRQPVLAAGGIVLRDGSPPLIAIVQLRKDKAWVLPKGKLKPGEDALAAARREVLEETGHAVEVHEFLGAMPEAPGAKPKTVQFWRMRAGGEPVRKLMRDVKAVKWLPLERATKALTHGHEQAFLAQVGPAALQAAARRAPVEPVKAPAHRDVGAAPNTFLEKIRAWFRRRTWSGA